MEHLFTILIPLVAILAIVMLAKKIASHSFQCPHCSHTFSIHWAKVLVTRHSGDAYLLTCPRCNTKDYCVEQKGETK